SAERFITAADHFSQKVGVPGGLGFAGLNRRYIDPVNVTILPFLSARSPSMAISAGRSVTAPMIAIATTTIAPIASERMTVELIRNSPDRHTIPVTPENPPVHRA